MKAEPERQMVFGNKVPPPKIANLIDDPVRCSKMAAVWPVIQEIGVAVIMELPLFCKNEGLDASATVLAANKILTTLEVFKDQAELDKKNASKTHEKNPTR